MLRLQLVELIRTSGKNGGDINPAIKFATEQLGPRAPTNPQFLEDLEKTMALLLFPQDALDPQLAALLDPNLRRDAADSVNRAILEKQSSRREAAIRQIVKMRSWAEDKARKNQIVLPSKIDIGLQLVSAESGRLQAGDAGNGHDSLMT